MDADLQKQIETAHAEQEKRHVARVRDAALPQFFCSACGERSGIALVWMLVPRGMMCVYKSWCMKCQTWRTIGAAPSPRGSIATLGDLEAALRATGRDLAVSSRGGVWSARLSGPVGMLPGVVDDAHPVRVATADTLAGAVEAVLALIDAEEKS